VSHEAIEVDRTRDTRVAREVDDLRLSRDRPLEPGHHGSRSLERRAFVHVDEQEELVLVVEWQHLQRHEAEGAHSRRSHGGHGRDHEECDTDGSTLHERQHERPEEPVEKRPLGGLDIVEAVWLRMCRDGGRLRRPVTRTEPTPQYVVG